MSSRYAISKCSSGWVIAVDGAMLLICESEAVALQTVRDAEANVYGAPHGSRGIVDARAPAPGRRKPLASTAA